MTIERDEWVRVKTLSADRALRFFGKPAGWLVREVPNTLDEVDGRRLFEVWAGNSLPHDQQAAREKNDE